MYQIEYLFLIWKNKGNVQFFIDAPEVLLS